MNSKTGELNALDDVMNRLESGTSDLGHEADIVAAKANLEAAKGELSDLIQSILQGRQKYEGQLLRKRQFEAARGKLCDWLQSLEIRLGAGIFANGSSTDKASIREQLKELENVAGECDALESEIAAICILLDPSESSADSKLTQGKAKKCFQDIYIHKYKNS